MLSAVNPCVTRFTVRTIGARLAGMTLGEFQQHIRDRYYATDVERRTPMTWLWFSEEIGELARALARRDNAKNLEEEFADVLAWLCTLANINDVDLAAAVEAKYVKDGGPAGAK